MKQLYIVGILIAIVLLVLMGLNKLNGKQSKTVDEIPFATTTQEVVPETSEATTTPPITNEATTSTTTMDTTTTKATTNVTFKTNKGDITLELYTKDMPITAGNFLKLAESNFYDGVKFHRVIDGFMIQGGDPLTKDDTAAARWGTGGPGYAIADEFGPRHSNAIGTISMANSGPNSGGSQFFINTANNTFLDGKHPVFGKVVAGMDVIEAIGKTATGPRDVPVSPIVINNIVVSE